MNKPVKPSVKIDMSPDAIDKRLHDLSELYKLGISIQNVKVK